MSPWSMPSNLSSIFTITKFADNLTQTDASEIVLSSFVTNVSTTINFVLFPLGVFTSIVNIIVYWRQGIRESVNITFVSLSLWNLVTCLLSCLSEIFHVIEMVAFLETVNMISLHVVFLGQTRGFTYVQMTLITVYLSLERCICIQYPFEVKEIFTTRRVILVNFAIIVFGLACYIPAWATQRMHWVFDPRTNMSRLYLWVSHNRHHVELFSVSFIGVALPFLAQTIIAVCTGYMLRGINESTKFRQRGTAVEKSGRLNGNEQCSAVANKANFAESWKTMTSKDLKLTKIVVLLAIKYFVCNIPVLIISFLTEIFPDKSPGNQYHSLYELLYGLVFECRVINCIIDMFVYYNVSSRYRKEFMILFNKSRFLKKQ